jgi:glycosyltransferase involved in cell wall biosynthesis
MRIAMIGQKGLPAAHGGVEHHVEQLGSRLAARGHEVVVYTRPSYSDPSITWHRGMQLKSLRSIPTKHLDAITHSAACSLASRRGGFDVVHYHAIGPCLTAPLVIGGGRRIVATVHGQDWRRAKWGRAATLALRAAEQAALRVPHATICVSRSLTERYAEQGFAEKVHYIPNGVTISAEDDPAYLAELHVEPGQYALFVGRLVPEKGPHYLIEAWRRLGTDRKLVVVGDSSFTDGYVDSLRVGDSNVVFTGYLYGAKLATVFRNAGLFVLPSNLEGLPIVLLESLAYGTPVLASDIAPSVEVLGEQGEYFRAGDVDDLTQRLGELLPRLGELKARSAVLQAAVLAEYDWDAVAEQTEALYAQLLASRRVDRGAVPAPAQTDSEERVA